MKNFFALWILVHLIFSCRTSENLSSEQAIVMKRDKHKSNEVEAVVPIFLHKNGNFSLKPQGNPEKEYTVCVVRLRWEVLVYRKSFKILEQENFNGTTIRKAHYSKFMGGISELFEIPGNDVNGTYVATTETADKILVLNPHGHDRHLLKEARNAVKLDQKAFWKKKTPCPKNHFSADNPVHHSLLTQLSLKSRN